MMNDDNTLKQLRRQTGLSQTAFAAKFGIPVSTLRDWEQNRRRPPEYVPGIIRRILELEQDRK